MHTTKSQTTYYYKVSAKTLRCCRPWTWAQLQQWETPSMPSIDQSINRQTLTYRSCPTIPARSQTHHVAANNYWRKLVVFMSVAFYLTLYVLSLTRSTSLTSSVSLVICSRFLSLSLCLFISFSFYIFLSFSFHPCWCVLPSFPLYMIVPLLPPSDTIYKSRFIGPHFVHISSTNCPRLQGRFFLYLTLSRYIYFSLSLSIYMFLYLPFCLFCVVSRFSRFLSVFLFTLHVCFCISFSNQTQLLGLAKWSAPAMMQTTYFCMSFSNQTLSFWD